MKIKLSSMLNSASGGINTSYTSNTLNSNYSFGQAKKVKLSSLSDDVSGSIGRGRKVTMSSLLSNSERQVQSVRSRYNSWQSMKDKAEQAAREAEQAKQEDDSDENRGGFLGGLSYIAGQAALAVVDVLDFLGGGRFSDTMNKAAGATARAISDSGEKKIGSYSDYVDEKNAAKNTKWFSTDTYARALDVVYNPSEGWQNARDVVNVTPYALNKLGDGATNTLEGAADLIGSGVAKLTGNDEAAKSLFDNDWKDYERVDKRYNVTEDHWMKRVGDVAGGIGSSLPSLAARSLDLVLPGAGTALSYGITYASSAGNATKAAYRATGELGAKEYGYGALVGATETGIEAISGQVFDAGTQGIANRLLSKFGKKSVEEAVQATAKAMSRSMTKQIFIDLGKDAVSEGLEEGIAEIVSPLWARLTYDEDAELATWGEIKYAMNIGALSGLIMSGGATAINTVQSANSGKKAAAEGRTQSILDKAKYFSEREAQNDTGYEIYKQLSDTYGRLKGSLEKTEGEVKTVSQRIALGRLQSLNTAATVAPFVEKSAQWAVLNAETAAQRLNSMGLRGVDGSAYTVTAEQISRGVDVSLYGKKTGQKKFAKQLRHAMETNPYLAAIASVDAAGQLMMDEKIFSGAEAEAQSVTGKIDLDRFKAEAPEEVKGAVGSLFKINDWSGVTRESFNEAVADKLTSPKNRELVVNAQRVMNITSVPSVMSQKAPEKLSANMSDGAYRYRFEDGGEVSVLKEGKKYFLYVPVEGKMTSELKLEDLNSVMKRLSDAAKPKVNRESLQSVLGEQNKTAPDGVQDDGVRYALSIKYSDGTAEKLSDARDLSRDDIKDYLNKAKSGQIYRSSYIPVRTHTPQVVIDTMAQVNESIKDNSLVMQAAKAQQAMSEKKNHTVSKRYGDNVRKHGLSVDQMVDIMDNLDSPSMVIYQTNRKDINQNPLPNNVVFFVEYGSDGSEGVAVIEFDSEIDSRFVDDSYGDTKFHTAITIFKPDTERQGMPFDYAEELLENPNNIEIPIIKREQSARSATGEILPTLQDKLLSNDIIPQSESVVNTKAEKSFDGVVAAEQKDVDAENIGSNKVKLSSLSVKKSEQAAKPKVNRESLQSVLGEQNKTAPDGVQERFALSLSENISESESGAVLRIIRENASKISTQNAFDVVYDDRVEKYVKKSEYVLDIFNKQGNIAHNKQIGDVELVKSGAKSTVMHGYGNAKLAAVEAIKPAIEQGQVISHTENYNNTGVDRYIIFSQGKINGEPAIIGVVVKSYPNANSKNKFYLHEVEIIKADEPNMTAPQLSVDTVGTSADGASPTTIIPKNEPVVNTKAEKSFESVVAVTEESQNTPAYKAKNLLAGNYARNNIKGYDKASSERQRIVQQSVRSAQESGASEAVISAVGRGSLRSGVVIEFNREMFSNSKKTVNGEEYIKAGMYKNGKIYINPDAKKPFFSLLIHEMEHVVFNADNRRVLSKIARKMATDEDINYIKDVYGHKDEGSDSFLDELTAHISERVLGTEEGMSYIVSEKPSLKEKILAFFGKAEKDYAHDSNLSREARRFARKYKQLFDMLADIDGGTAHGEAREAIYFNKYSDDTIESNTKEISRMSSVYDVDKSKLEKTGKKPSDIYKDFFESIGNSIYSEEFGDISLGRSSIKSEIRHGITSEKLASIEAIPAVIKEGKVIFAQTKSGSNVERIVVAAPIKIGPEGYYMGVMLQRDSQNQRLYLHNVVIEKRQSQLHSVGGLQTLSNEESDSLFITSILQKALGVKYSDENIGRNALEQADNDKYGGKENASTKKGAPQLIDVNVPDATSESGFAVTPNNSMPQNSENSNTSEEKNSGKKFALPEGEEFNAEEALKKGMPKAEGRASISVGETQARLAKALGSLGRYDATRRRHIESREGDRVASSYDDIKKFILDSSKNESVKRLHIGVINDSVSELVKNRTGIDIHGFDFVIASNYIAHIFDRHGNVSSEAMRNQSAVTYDNIDNILETVISPDDVQLTSDKNGKAIKFIKNINGENVAITVTSTKKSTLTLKSAWIINNSGGRTLSADNKIPARTPETNSRSSANNIIAQSSENSNTFDEKTSEEKFALPEGEEFNTEEALKKGMPKAEGRASISVGETQARLANTRAGRVYTQEDALKVINGIPGIKELKSKERLAMAKELWPLLNKLQNGQERAQTAREVAEYITAKILTDAQKPNTEGMQNAKEELAYYKSGIGSLVFSESDKAEILHIADKSGAKSITARWGYKGKGKVKISVDQFVTDIAREMPGMEYLGEMHPIDAFIEINDMYLDAKERAAERTVPSYVEEDPEMIKHTISEIESSIMEAYKSGGTPSVFSKNLASAVSHLTGQISRMRQDRQGFKMKQKKESFFRSYKRLFTRLFKPTKERNIHQGMQELFAESLAKLNINDVDVKRAMDYQEQIEKLRRADNPNAEKISTLEARRDAIMEKYEKVYEHMGKLKDAYAEFKNSGDPVVSGAFDENISRRLDEYYNVFKDARLGDMTLEQLTAAERFVSELLRVASNSNRLFMQGKQERASDMAEQIMSEIEDAKIPELMQPKTVATRAAGAVKGFMWNNFKPPHFFDFLGSPTLTKLYEQLHRGELVWGTDIARSQEFFGATAEKYGYYSWDQNIKHQFTATNGKRFELNLGQIMSLYAYVKRENAHEHLRVGGFKFAPNTPIKNTKAGIDSFRRVLNSSETFTTDGELLAEIEKTLTAGQKEFVDVMQEYLSKTVADWGNEVSMKLYGIKLFGEKHYFPMMCANEYLESATGAMQGDPKIKNKGMAKPITPNAKNPLVLGDFLDVWSKHVNDMAQYHGMVLPTEDLNKVLNYIPNAKFEEAVDGQEDSRKSGIELSKNISEYPYNIQTVIKEYLESFDQKILDFINEHFDNGKIIFGRQKISDVNDRQVDDIEKLLDINVRGYTNNINTNAIMHIRKRHGVDGIADHSMSNEDDLARVGYILENYDNVEIVKDGTDNVNSKEFMNSQNSPAPMLLFSKKINGTYYVVQAIPDSGYKKLWVVSAYINKNGAVTQALNTKNNSTVGKSLASPAPEKGTLATPLGERAPNNTPEANNGTDSSKEVPTDFGVSRPVGNAIKNASSNNSIPQNGENVKSDSQKSENEFYPESVKSLMSKKYGSEAVEYIRQLLVDINGGIRPYNSLGGLDALLSNFKRVSTMMSASVFVQQFSSLPRAMSVIDPKYFAGKPKKEHLGAAWEEIKEWASIAILKEMGGYDAGTGSSTSSYIQAREYKGLSKVGALIKDKDYRNEAFGKPSAWADKVTWIQIWEACLREQIDIYNKAHPNARINQQSIRTDEALMRRVAERFDYVITRTQVYDSVLSRSTHMRNKNGLVKMATAFMAEPTTVANMIMVGAAKRARGERGMGRVVGSVVAATILNTALASIVYAARDDDEEQTYSEKYVEQFAGGLKDSFNPLTYFPIARDMVSIFQGYDIERSDMAVISDFYNTLGDVYRDIENGNVSFDTVMNFVANTGSLFALPTRNIYRDARGLWNTVTSAAFSGKETTRAGLRHSVIQGFTGRTVTNGQQLYDSLISGDFAHYNKVLKRFSSTEKAMSAMKVALRDSDKRIAAAAEAKLAGDMDTYNALINEIYAEGFFKKMYIISAVSAEINEMKGDAEKTGGAVFIKDSATGQDIMYTLDGETAAKIDKKKAELEGKVEAMQKSRGYLSLTLEQREVADYYADGLIEDAAYSSVLGIQIDKASSLTKIVGIGNVAVLYSKTRGISSDIDAYGEAISGSKRKKVIRAINSLGVSPAQRLLLLCSQGYSIKDGDIPGVTAANAKTALMKYILKLKVSRSEKEYLITMCGFTVQNGKIILKKS